MTRDQVQEVRAATQAGKFYPASKEFLSKVIDDYLKNAGNSYSQSPKALIVPHSGLIYSGAVAAQAFAAWMGQRDEVERIVLVGPSHHFDFPGIALPGAAAFETPLGLLSIDEEWIEMLDGLSSVRDFAAAHENEHSLEVELPFIQRIFGNKKIIPLITGRCSDIQVHTVLQKLWGGPETKLVISSDLSHFMDYGTARRVDRKTADLIENLDYRKLTPEQACGCLAIRGLLRLALEREMRCSCVDLRNSGDTAGSDSNLIGFGAFVFYEE